MGHTHKGILKTFTLIKSRPKSKTGSITLMTKSKEVAMHADKRNTATGGISV